MKTGARERSALERLMLMVQRPLPALPAPGPAPAAIPSPNPCSIPTPPCSGTSPCTPTRTTLQWVPPQWGSVPQISASTRCTNRIKAEQIPPGTRLPPLPTYRECNLALNATLKTRAQIWDAVIKSLPLSAACCGAPSGRNRSPRISRSLCCASGCSQAIPGEERDKGSKQGLLLACGSLITCCSDVYSERQEVWIPLSFFSPWLIFRLFLYRGRKKEGGKCNRASRKASLGWCSTALHGVVPPTLPWPWDRAHS